MNRQDLGQYFIKGGELYMAIGYIENPAIELKNIKTGQNEVVVIGSMLSHEYSKLFSAPCEKGVYNLDKAIPVENINLESEVN